METKTKMDLDVDDEGQALYFPKKRKSAANIILEDDDDDDNKDDDNYDHDEDDDEDDVDFDWSRIPSSVEAELLRLKEKLLSPPPRPPPDEEYSLSDEEEIKRIEKDEKRSEAEKREQIQILRKLQAHYNKYCKNAPPLYNDDVGQLDISGAVLVRVNGRRLKKYSKSDYDSLVDFMYSCHQKRNLELFYHPGDPNLDGLGAVEGKRLKDEDYDLAALAIDLYHRAKGEEELELRDLMKKNFRWGGGFVCYLTFSAVNKKTGVIRTYQAAIAEDDDDEPLLGLFRDLTTSKTLAILSISGAEEDYAAKVKHFAMALRSKYDVH